MTVSLDESYEYCQVLAKRTARNFYFSFLGLPTDKFRSMCVLYAFMRLSDDLGDNPNLSISERRKDLTRWRQVLQKQLTGSSELIDTEDQAIAETRLDGSARLQSAVFPALRDVILRFRIPHEYFFAVIDGVCMDLGPVCFETFADLTHYCYHVAGAVGLCCIHVWGFHDQRAIEFAVDCGTAFQLTNILRDLAEDVRMDRVYLPQVDLLRFDYRVEDLAHHRRGDHFRRLMQFEVERAKLYYHKAERLFECLEPAGKPILRAMLRVYGGLLTEIERRNYDVFSRPITLPAWRKLLIAADAIVRRRWFPRV